MEYNQIIQGDSLTVLKTLPDESVDLVLTDPPYNISKLNDNRDRSKLNSPIMRRESPLKYDFGEWDNMERKDFIDFTSEWLELSCLKLKDGGTIISFFNKEDISLLGWLSKEWGIRTRTIISWHKTNPVPSFRKVNYLSACEFIWIGSKGNNRWTFNFGYQKDMHNFFETSNKSCYGVTDHPTEKPITLIKHLIEIHSNKNDIVLDPFLGSGTTAVACKELNRRYLGIELKQEYIDMANKRISKIPELLF
jgi:DNA modification methylase